MRRFAALFLVYSVLTIPVAAQRGGRGSRGGTGGFARDSVAARYPGGRFRGGFLPRNPYFGFSFPGNWLDDAAGSEDSDYGYSDFSYSTPAPPYSYPVYYSPGPTPPVIQQSPPSLIEYRGPAHTCPQGNGKPLDRIAVPADTRERKIPPTYQNNLWVVQDYSFGNGTLKFTTADGEQKQTSIRSVDRDLTLRLNLECDANLRFLK